MDTIVPIEVIEKKIYLIRGQKVMLDRDLAQLYGVETRILNQAVRRNIDRFPPDFMFSLTREEIMRISQIVISSMPRENTTLKFSKNVQVFTEHGVAILSRRLDELEEKYDAQFRVVFDAIRQLMAAPEPREKKIGFRVSERIARYGTSSR